MIKEYIESQRIKGNRFKTKKAALLNSIIYTIGWHEKTIYIQGKPRVKFTE